MVTLEIDVYDINNGGTPYRLQQAHARMFLDDLHGFGTASFAVDVAAEDDWAALDYGKVCRFVVDGTARFAGVIRDMPKTFLPGTASSPEGWSRIVQCDGLLSWLGYGRGGGLMYPAKGIHGPGIAPRHWGPRGFDFPDPGWPEPATQPTTRAGFPDSRARSVLVEGKTLTRRVLAATPDRATDNAVMWFACSAGVDAQMYFDGSSLPIFDSPIGDQTVTPRNHPYDGDEHVVVIETKGTGTVVWSWATVTHQTWIDDNGDEQTRDINTFLFRTFNTADFDSFTAPAWQQLLDYDTYPGVTPGYIGTVVLAENKNPPSGFTDLPPMLPNVTADFTAANHSGGTAWPDFIAHGFRIQEVGRLCDDMSGLVDLDIHMTPSGVWRMWPRRGVDRTASVTLVEPFEQADSGEGPTLTRILYETEGGFGEGYNEDAEGVFGPLGVVMQFGTGIGPEQLEDTVTKTLNEEAKVTDQITVQVPDGVTPFVDFDNGDTVMVDSPDGARPARTTAIALADDPTTGWPEWEVRANA